MPLNFAHINGNEQIVPGSIGGALLQDGSVTASKLAIGAISSTGFLVNSNIDYNNFLALDFRIENVTTNPLPGNPGRLVWNTTLNDLFVDADTTVTISNISNASFSITSIVDATHMLVSSTTGIAVGDTIAQGSSLTKVTSVIGLTELVVISTAGFIAKLKPGCLVMAWISSS
jgi:hypothetical protein